MKMCFDLCHTIAAAASLLVSRFCGSKHMFIFRPRSGIMGELAPLHELYLQVHKHFCVYITTFILQKQEIGFWSLLPLRRRYDVIRKFIGHCEYKMRQIEVSHRKTVFTILILVFMLNMIMKI